MDKGPYRGTNANQTPNTASDTRGVRLRGISFVAKRDNSPDHQLRPPKPVK
jgi:hypothetical protein